MDIMQVIIQVHYTFGSHMMNQMVQTSDQENLDHDMYLVTVSSAIKPVVVNL